MKLNVNPNLARPDDVYEWLIELHRDLSDEASARANARLILLLINHIGDDQVVRDAIGAARASAPRAHRRSNRLKAERCYDGGMGPHESTSKQLMGSSDWLAQLARVTRSLGQKEFETEVLALLNLALPIDHCVVFTYGAEGVGHLFTHGKMPAERAQELAVDYVRQYHDRDPLFAKLTSTQGADLDRPQPLDLNTEYDPAYRNHFFDRNGLIDKTATVGRIEGGSVLCNFYRMAGSRRYSSADREQLERVLPLVTAYIEIHYRLVKQLGHGNDSLAPSRTSTRSLVHTIIGKRVVPFDRLTAREREVCERILLGYTSIGIGIDLDISLSSVLTPTASAPTTSCGSTSRTSCSRFALKP